MSLGQQAAKSHICNPNLLRPTGLFLVGCLPQRETPRPFCGQAQTEGFSSVVLTNLRYLPTA